LKEYIFLKKKYSIIISSSKARRKQIEYFPQGVSSQEIIFMPTYESIKMYFCKERNRLVGSSNFLAWKKRTYLTHIK